MIQEERRTATRRSSDILTADRLQRQVDEMHTRIFNGLGKELRQEMKDEIGGVRNLFIGVLVSLLVIFGGIVVEGRVSAGQASSENNRNYKAIVDLSLKLEQHILNSEEVPCP